MKLVKQRGEHDCAIAALAMFAGVSYATASAICPVHDRGGHVADVVNALLELGYDGAYVSRAGYNMPLESAGPSHEPQLMVIREPGTDWGHWIVRAGPWVFDPEMKRRERLESYSRRGWNVVRIVTV